MTTGIFTNTNTITVDSGSNTLSAPVEIINNGAVVVASGATETVTAPLVDGTGFMHMATGGHLFLNAETVGAGQTIDFDDGTGTLEIKSLGGFAATIGSIVSGDTIIVDGLSVASTSFNPSSHLLTLKDGLNATLGFLQFGTSVTDVSGLTVVGSAPCFVSGTRIATGRGPVPVERLREGDMARLARGGTAPVRWVGRRTVKCAKHCAPEKVWPVRISAGAFGPGAPERDLYLSPDHAVYIDEVLIPVKLLCNSTTVAQVRRRSVSYYHVELPRHDVILAEGLACESYLDVDGRSCFDNGGSPVMLHPDFAAHRWEAAGVAPLVLAGPHLEAAKAAIAKHADALVVHADPKTESA